MTFGDEKFSRFIAPDCDRLTFIVDYLEKNGVKSVVMPIEGRNHIYVVFSKSAYNPMFNIKTVVAHYDRFEGSPGANDNSSSVYFLMKWACELNRCDFQHNIRLIFTDGEELGSGTNGSSIGEQGAFGLASVFKRLGLTNDDVFVFDCTGRGSVPVLQRTLLPSKTPKKFLSRFEKLFARTQNLLQMAGGGTWVTLPVSYSDNAGFLVNGIAAVAITMLPKEEASKYMYDLLQVPGLESFVTNKAVPEEKTREQMEELLPVTWRLLHTSGDNLDSLTEEAGPVMERILNLLAQMKTVCS